MNRNLVSTGILAIVALAADHVLSLEARLAQLEQTPRVEPEYTRELSRRLSTLHTAVAEAQHAIESDERAEIVAGKLAVVSHALAREQCRIDAQIERFEAFESEWSDHGPETLDRRFEDLDFELAWRDDEIADVRELAEQTNAIGQTRWSELERQVEPLLEQSDLDLLWRDTVGPVVQLAGDATVGSGVLLRSRPRASGQGHVTHLITAWHVVRDIYGSIERVHMPVPVRMYRPDGSRRDETAHMVVYDVELDIALLELDIDEALPYGARLASRDELESVRVFDPVYAVGCPLGNDPIPTEGEVASIAHQVDTNSYWMVSAPTYIGNSGGGIFDERTHALIGIFSKIYTHGAARSTIVPHMGLATPLTQVYDWLDERGFTALVDGEPHVQAASAQR